jgi:hypothetical protein
VGEAGDQRRGRGGDAGDDEAFGEAEERRVGAGHSRWPAIGGGGFSAICWATSCSTVSTPSV